MRILVATPTFAPQIGGAETWTRSVFAGLVRRGHDVRVVARAAPGSEQPHEVEGMQVTRVPGGRERFFREIARSITQHGPDVVAAQYAALPASLMLGRRHRVPVVAIVHDVYGWRESWRVKGLVAGTQRRMALELALKLLPPQHVLAPSNATAVRIRRLLPGVVVTVVPAGADHLRRRSVRRPVPGTVLFVGRLVHQKGVADLVEAMAQLRRDGAVSATIVGQGPEKHRAESLAARLGAPVRFAHTVTDDELDALLCEAAVLALPSTREGWGLAITEAAARGTPYVAYDIPAVREQHSLLQGGVLVEPRPEALANALRRMLADPRAAEARARAAATRAAALTWDAAAPVVERAFEVVTSQRG